MSKKIIISTIVIVVVLAAIFFFYKKTQAPSPKEQNAVVNAVTQSAVGGGVQKTNPFNVNVNPYQGYKNPFQ